MNEGVSQRVLILVASARDASVVAGIVAGIGATPVRCSQVSDVIQEMDAGVDAVVVAEDAIEAGSMMGLAAALGSQPEWSSPPVLLLSAEREPAWSARERIPGLQVLERPIGVATLESALVAALASRRRQYQVRDLIREATERERELRRSEALLQRELETTRALVEAADALAEWTDLQGVLDALTHAVLRATSHTRATFALWDEMTNEVRVVASSGAEPIAGSTTALEDFSAPFRQVAATREALVADYDAMPSAQKRMADQVRSRKGLLVPVDYRGRLVGGLFVDDPGSRGDFPAEEIRLVQAIAAQAAVAIENARLFEAQSQIASTLQHALVRVPPQAPGIRFSHLYRSATEEALVGGDFYDVIPLRDEGYVLLVGDVSGHGVGAARWATFVRDSVAAFATADKGVEQILAETNEALIRRGMPGFVSMLLATLSPDRRRVTFCSAGHPHFTLSPRDGETRLAGKKHAPPLGVFPDWSCSSEHVSLSPGDLLFFYTDGLTEARNDGDMYGEQRLIAAVEHSREVSLTELPELMLAEALAFSGGTLGDDVAILAVEIEG